MTERHPDGAAVTMVSVVQFAPLVELTVQRVYQLCQQNILPRIVDGNLLLIAGMQAYIRYLRGRACHRGRFGGRPDERFCRRRGPVLGRSQLLGWLQALTHETRPRPTRAGATP